MDEIMELAESLWQGETDTFANHPISSPYGMVEVAKDTWFYKGFSNAILRATKDGLVLVDPGGVMDHKAKFEAIRAVTQDRLNTAVFTHGHIDHVFGMPRFVEEAEANGWARPRVIAHEAMLGRFQRYKESRSWNSIINGRQFQGNSSELLAHGILHARCHLRGPHDRCGW
jgi:glyoxylase-like metal-dependent hydrolase (beta-lactamase superfamily II)